MNIEDAIASDPEVQDGALCFRGTQVPVRNLFEHLERGHSVDLFLDSFDSVSREQVVAVLSQARTLVEQSATQDTALDREPTWTERELRQEAREEYLEPDGGFDL
ncbi:MAG TPA: DUF433 domain-containing protein [Fimbriimonadaceae bacterium]|jgi:uncharacterized protein (DUF433 family)|nr:DUF433 domain-containing protein [Fimbriimonadaceae bacterium]